MFGLPKGEARFARSDDDFLGRSTQFVFQWRLTGCGGRKELC